MPTNTPLLPDYAFQADQPFSLSTADVRQLLPEPVHQDLDSAIKALTEGLSLTTLLTPGHAIGVELSTDPATRAAAWQALRDMVRGIAPDYAILVSTSYELRAPAGSAVPELSYDEFIRQAKPIARIVIAAKPRLFFLGRADRLSAAGEPRRLSDFSWCAPGSFGGWIGQVMVEVHRAGEQRVVRS